MLSCTWLMIPQDRVRVVVSEFEENLDKSSFKNPRDYAIANAEGKAREVRQGTVLPRLLSSLGICAVSPYYCCVYKVLLSSIKTLVWHMIV